MGESIWGARDPQTYAIIGAAMEVHKRLSAGFLEAAYKEALAIEFELRGIPFRKEVPVKIYYRDRELDCTYKADFICFEDVIVEAKAVKQITSVDRAQTLNYLKATRFARGLLLNFGAPSLEFERIVLTPIGHLDPPMSQSAQSAKSAVTSSSAFPKTRVSSATR